MSQLAKCFSIESSLAGTELRQDQLIYIIFGKTIGLVILSDKYVNDHDVILSKFCTLHLPNDCLE